ncbi:hydroxyacylglutathione hydrolase [Sulfitobacter pontiacus]|uniref:hydroxyacylglutathione hydrolase n=1 Tax=Sulfitobacter pontiacus TaxID=60137 RepID=UPI00276ADA54|nr:hydroxyacylglutathione hydrolase [Sulfitobacter pontiacus]GLO79109.1 hydroxyacylglutathione hydrolase [Sulfitobacter pontiacus]
MSFDLVTIPCLSDNYAFLLRDQTSGKVALIDVPEAAPITAKLDELGWTLTEIWLTHHHPDHIQGVPALIADHPARVIGAEADAERLPPLDAAYDDGQSFTFGAHTVDVIDVSGHTVGHIAFHVPAAKCVFTADSLMALGCGRLFEGTPAQMWDSLQKLMRLPADTTVCSGHEYTQSNAKFALTVDPENAALISRAREIDQARADGEPTVPSTLSTELETNPFLRPSDPGIRAQLGMVNATDTDVFAEIRARKDRF